ncbi:hypothetical protein LTS18_014973 [Coniosporium uncinatum]|uniref:Uncharacterized protein n=1 Tax=Coniosporium uncinatum TaxID=93489 RepID=A0ACC3DYJ8_9PEZI|nr:hypothetical protein LTS18_014973 [Coniosporium uncinatum]
MIALYIPHRRAKRAGALANFQTPYQRYGPAKLMVALFWQLDVIGIILLIAVFALILVPFTIAGGRNPKLGREQSLPDAEETGYGKGEKTVKEKKPWWQIF